MTMKNKGNLKAENSKQLMTATILKLMEREKFEEITIQEITDNAGLSRRTFYRNYSSKDEIIADYFSEIWSEYQSLIIKESDLSLPNIARALCRVMSAHIDFLKIANRQHLMPIILEKVDELLPITFDEVRGDSMPFKRESIRYALIFNTGGFMRLFMRWLDEGYEKSQDEIADIVNDILQIENYTSHTMNQGSDCLPVSR